MSEHEQSRVVGTTATGEPMSDADKPVVVGVDGSLHNASAVEWAVDEAEGAHRTLCLVTGTAEFNQPRVGVGTEYVVAYDSDLHFNRTMIDLARRIRTEHPSVLVSPSVRRGEASACLAELSRTASVVVVGKRGLGGVRRAMLGSTSIATVGRTRCPTVVVPDDWMQRAHAGEPLLVGIDLEHDSDPVLDFAFARAQRMGVPLIAVHVWDVHPFAVLRPTSSHTVRSTRGTPWRESSAIGVRSTQTSRQSRARSTSIRLEASWTRAGTPSC